jgi:hypothetical protein
MTEEKDIIGYAADAVESTQMSSNISSRPSIMRGSETKKMLTDFMSVPLALYGLVNEEQSRNVDASTVNKAKVLSYVLLSTAILPSIMGTLINNPGKLFRTLGGEEDEEEYLADMAADAIGDALDIMMPVFGRTAWSLYKGDMSKAAPAIRSVEAASRGLRAGVEMINPMDEKEEVTTAEYRAMLDVITLTTLIPASSLNRGFKTLVDLNPDLDPDR